MKRCRTEGEVEVGNITLANVLVLLSRGAFAAAGEADQGLAQHHPERVFECKTCNRRFPSFQALGGHRASHKKPRLPGDQPAAAARPRVHGCSICGVEFSIGQALGGHMRRHRAAAAAAALRDALTEKKADVVVVGDGGRGEVLILDLDLNLSPPEDDVDVPGLGLGIGLPAVDCVL